MAADLGDLVARILLDSKEFNAAMKGVEAQAEETSGKAGGFLSGIGGSLGGIAETALGVVAGLGMKEVLGWAIDLGPAMLEAASKTEHLATAFRAIAGPTEATAKLFDDLSNLEFHSLFDFEDTLGPAAKNMLDLGVSTEQTGKTMIALVDAASGMKKGPEWIEKVSGAIATMQTHMVASAKDMKALEAEGVSAWSALAAKIGTDVPAAMEKVKAGTISAQTVTEAVTEDMGKRWKGAGDESLAGWEGAMHIMEEATEEVMVAVGKSIGDVIVAIKPVIDVAVQAILALAKAWVDLGGQVGWISENWPAIKAVWAELSSYLGDVFEYPLKRWENDWNAIKAIFATVFEYIGKAIGVFTQGLTTLFGWISSAVSAIPGVTDEMKKLSSIWDDQTAKIKANKEATEARKNAQDAATAADVKARNEAKAREAQDVANANAAKKFAEERKKADTELLAFSKQWVAADKAFQDSQKKNEDVFTKAYYAMKKAAVDTIEIIVPLYDRLGAVAGPLAKRFFESKEAMEKLGVTSTTVLTQAVASAKDYADKVRIAYEAGERSASDYGAAVAKVKDAQEALKNHTERDLVGAMKTLGTVLGSDLKKAADDMLAAYKQLEATTDVPEDLYPAWQKVLEAQQRVADHTNKEMADAYHNLGVRSAAEMRTMATEAEAAYQKIARNAGDNSVAAKEAWITKTQETYAAILAEGGTLTQGQKSELDRAKIVLDQHLQDTGSMWRTAYEGVHGAVTGMVDSLINKLVTGEGSFKEIMTTMWQDIASAALHTFIDPLKKAIADFIATTIADLLSGNGLGGVLDSLKSIGKAAEGVFGGAGSSVPGVPGGAPSVPSVPGGGGAGAAVSAGLTGWIGAISGAITAISSVIGNFQMAKMETSLNAIEHNTRYTMMYVGEQADGGIYRASLKIFEELAYGTLVKAMEKHRDQFYDWTGFVNPIFETIRNSVMDSYPVLVDIRTILGDMRELATNLQTDVRSNAETLKQINVSITAQGITTAEAARALGDQIAANLSRQMVPVA
jgi:hypothetical protein